MTLKSDKKPSPDGTAAGARLFLSRRELLQTCAAAASLAALGGVGADTAPSATTQRTGSIGGEKYNILYLMTDQHCFNVLGCLGHPLIKTPRLDELARGGVIFENAYSPAPVCGPARASMFTGYYLDKTDARGNHKPLNPALTVLPELLRQSGMQTALVGKWHLTPFNKSWGFEFRQLNDAMVNIYTPGEADASDYMAWASKAMGISQGELTNRFEGDEKSKNWYRFYMGSSVTTEPHHYNTWVADQSIRFLTERLDGRPFFLYSSFFGPHQPMLPPEPWASTYRPEDVELIPQFHAGFADKPIFRGGMQHRPPRADIWTDSMYRKVFASYFGQISQIDYHIGRIIDALKTRGLYDKTIIIFTSDHGDHHGQFRMLSKGTMYENSVHVPMIVRAPGQAPQGQRRPHVVGTIDLFHTLLRRQGLSAPADCPSRDLWPIFLDPAAPWKNEVRASLNHQSMIRRDNWKLIRFDLGKNHTPAYELYNMDQKPFEMVNHYEDSRASTARQELQRELDPWHAIQQTDTPLPKEANPPEGQNEAAMP